MQKILLTCALPYANGSLHLGHILEFIQTDIFARHKRMQGNEVYFICGNDAHGTPIMLNAKKANKTPEELVAGFHQEHKRDLDGFLIGLNHFGSTHTKANQTLVNEFYDKLTKEGAIHSKTIMQLFDPVENMFLPDRFVKGTCPKCKAEDQYGDGCEVCGSTYGPTDLINPKSVLSNATPVEKESLHYFFALSKYQDFLKNWLQTNNRCSPEIQNKLKEWLDKPLHDWDISRDSPYFGFKIPGNEDKYFYVWLDAPIGYLSIFQEYLENKIGLEKAFEILNEFTSEKTDNQIIHFIGKDIVYFHTLFWPAMLHGAAFKTPSKVNVHGFLTVNGKKMSKSRGTFMLASDYLKHLQPDLLRYYFASRLSSGIEDVDFNLEEFVNKINADLVGKYVNIISRCSKILSNNFSNTITSQVMTAQQKELINNIASERKTIYQHFDSLEYAEAVRLIMRLLDNINKLINDEKPWQLVKEGNLELAHGNLSASIIAVSIITEYLLPIIPQLTAQVFDILNCKGNKSIQEDIKQHQINNFQHILERITMDDVNKLSSTEAETTTTPTPVEETKFDKVADEIEITDFAKVDLRIAKIVAAEEVKEADKLLKLTLDVGFGTRQVFAGIKSAYKPEDLIGKLTVCVANLKPRKMRFGMSEGMVLAAGPGGNELYILEPHDGAKPGMRVK